MVYTQQEQDINLIGLLREFWSARLFLVLGLCCGLAGAFCFLALAQPRYEARMMVGPADTLNTTMQARYTDGPASYIFSEKNSPMEKKVSDFVRFEAMIRGVSVARYLISDERVLQGLRQDRAFIFGDGRTGVQATDLAKYFGQRVKLDPFGETDLKEISYKHSDPDFAAYLLQQLHRTADQLIRADSRAKVDERIAYLERVIAKTVNAEQRRILTNLLLEQQRARMTLAMDAPVAASVIEPVAVSSRPVWPDVPLFYSGFGFLGMLMGYIVFGLVSSLQPRVESTDATRQVQRGDELRHAPKRPIKYGSWFRDSADNDTDISQARRKDVSDAAE